MGHLLFDMVPTHVDETRKLLKLPCLNVSRKLLWNAGQLLWSGSVSLFGTVCLEWNRSMIKDHLNHIQEWICSCSDGDYPLLITLATIDGPIYYPKVVKCACKDLPLVDSVLIYLSLYIYIYTIIYTILSIYIYISLYIYMYVCINSSGFPTIYRIWFYHL